MNDESVVHDAENPEQRKAHGSAAWVWRSSGRSVPAGRRGQKLLPAPETIGLDAVFPAILLALVVPALKRTTDSRLQRQHT